MFEAWSSKAANAGRCAGSMARGLGPPPVLLGGDCRPCVAGAGLLRPLLPLPGACWPGAGVLGSSCCCTSARRACSLCQMGSGEGLSSMTSTWGPAAGEARLAGGPWPAPACAAGGGDAVAEGPAWWCRAACSGAACSRAACVPRRSAAGCAAAVAWVAGAAGAAAALALLRLCLAGAAAGCCSCCWCWRSQASSCCLTSCCSSADSPELPSPCSSCCSSCMTTVSWAADSSGCCCCCSCCWALQQASTQGDVSGSRACRRQGVRAAGVLHRGAGGGSQAQGGRPRGRTEGQLCLAPARRVPLAGARLARGRLPGGRVARPRCCRRCCVRLGGCGCGLGLALGPGLGPRLLAARGCRCRCARAVAAGVRALGCVLGLPAGAGRAPLASRTGRCDSSWGSDAQHRAAARRLSAGLGRARTCACRRCPPPCAWAWPTRTSASRPAGRATPAAWRSRGSCRARAAPAAPRRRRCCPCCSPRRRPPLLRPPAAG